MPTLTDVFAAVETAQAGLQTADAGKQNAQQKFDAATAAKAAADSADVDAGKAFNAAIDDAITALTAAKLPATTGGTGSPATP